MRVLVIAPHPDDETLGCGGTLLKHCARGDTVSWLIATRGHEPQWPAELLRRKEDEIGCVAAAYGFERVFRLGFPTVRMETLAQSEMMDAIRGAIEEGRPECVYLNHYGDVHSDHRVLFEATIAVLKPFYTAKHGVRRILSYETLSSTEAAAPNPARVFVPTVFSDVSSLMERKLEIMSLFESEVQPFPLPRSIEVIRALGRVRGATIGVEYAEAFMLIRETI